MHKVVVLEMNEKALRAGVDYVEKVLSRDVAKNLITEDRKSEMVKALVPTTNYASLKVGNLFVLFCIDVVSKSSQNWFSFGYL